MCVAALAVFVFFFMYIPVLEQILFVLMNFAFSHIVHADMAVHRPEHFFTCINISAEKCYYRPLCWVKQIMTNIINIIQLVQNPVEHNT